jgi:Xaa-Pro aminopeptidase
MSASERCLEAMSAADVDVLVLGREANARVVAQTRRLWLAGTRAFAPGCVVVRATGAVHVLANSEELVGASIPHDHLYGITWNPERLAANLTAIDGIPAARRVGVDGMTPTMAAVLAKVAPGAELVDAAPVMSALWRGDQGERRAGVFAAADVARRGLEAMQAALQPGARARNLRGACAQAFAALGVTTPAFEGVAAPLAAGGSTWFPPERAFDGDETVVLRAGALWDGWEASLARTFTVGLPATESPAPDGWDAAVDACRAGVAVGTVRATGAIVYGVGRGVEPWDDGWVLAPGSCVAVEVEHGDRLRQDVVLVTDDAPEVLTAGRVQPEI